MIGLLGRLALAMILVFALAVVWLACLGHVRELALDSPPYLSLWKRRGFNYRIDQGGCHGADPRPPEARRS